MVYLFKVISWFDFKYVCGLLMILVFIILLCLIIDDYDWFGDVVVLKL